MPKHLSLPIVILSSLFLILAFSGCDINKNNLPKKQVKNNNNLNILQKTGSSQTISKKNQSLSVVLAYKDKSGNFYLSDQNQSILVPLGYKLVSQYEYQTNPTYLILEKNNQIYTYNTKTKKIKPFALPSDKLNKDEELNVYPSISEDGQFLVVIKKYSSKENSDSKFPDYKTQVYLYDARTDKTERTSPKLNLSQTSVSCIKYDSIGERMFTWSCEEGMSFGPLEAYDVYNGGQKPDFSFPTNSHHQEKLNDLNVYYNQGLFFVINQNNKITLIDPTVKDRFSEDLSNFKIKIKDLKIPLEVANEINNDPRDLTVSYNASHQVLLINQQKNIFLIHYSNDLIIDSKKISFPNSQGECKANQIFTIGQHLYITHKNNNQILDINLVDFKHIFYPLNIKGEMFNVFIK